MPTGNGPTVRVGTGITDLGYATLVTGNVRRQRRKRGLREHNLDAILLGSSVVVVIGAAPLGQPRFLGISQQRVTPLFVLELAGFQHRKIKTTVHVVAVVDGDTIVQGCRSRRIGIVSHTELLQGVDQANGLEKSRATVVVDRVLGTPQVA